MTLFQAISYSKISMDFEYTWFQKYLIASRNAIVWVAQCLNADKKYISFKNDSVKEQLNLKNGEGELANLAV